jgi:hypothetical protein
MAWNGRLWAVLDRPPRTQYRTVTEDTSLKTVTFDKSKLLGVNKTALNTWMIRDADVPSIFTLAARTYEVKRKCRNGFGPGIRTTLVFATL